MSRGIQPSGEFKQQVVEDVINNHLYYSEAMRKYGIHGKMCIQRWERIYRDEGAQALYQRKRRPANTSAPMKPQARAIEPEDLQARLKRENEFLRAENDYLKNLRALVQGNERRQRTKRG